jgi:two-component sensor histidine kinase
MQTVENSLFAPPVLLHRNVLLSENDNHCIAFRAPNRKQTRCSTSSSNFATSDSTLYWLVLGSDLAIASAYFAIPLTMWIVLRDRKDDIPYQWLWILFVTFIIACGLTHTSHVWSAATGADYLAMHAGISLFCAAASVGTSVAFVLIVPEIKKLPSPKQQRAKLEHLVTQRTSEKDRLILEINHRVGNQLQKVRSMLSVESRRTELDETLAVLNRIIIEVDKMAVEHLERSQTDYLSRGVRAADGSIVGSSGAALEPSTA